MRLLRTMPRWLLKVFKEETPQPLWASCTSAATRAVQKCFLMCRWSLWFPFVSVASCPGAGHH